MRVSEFVKMSEEYNESTAGEHDESIGGMICVSVYV